MVASHGRVLLTVPDYEPAWSELGRVSVVMAAGRRRVRAATSAAC